MRKGALHGRRFCSYFVATVAWGVAYSQLQLGRSEFSYEKKTRSERENR